MQIGAINSINFKSNMSPRVVFVTPCDNCPYDSYEFVDDNHDIIDVECEPISDESSKTSQSNSCNIAPYKNNQAPRDDKSETKKIAEELKKQSGSFQDFVNDVAKAKNDVSPITCLVGILTGAIALQKGIKAVGWARGTLAKGGCEITQGAVKAFSKVTKKNTEKACGNINNFFNKFTNNVNVDQNSEKMAKKFTEILDAVFGTTAKKGQKVSERTLNTLNKAGIFLNPRRLFDTALALTVAYKAADVTSDVTEQALDGQKIKNSGAKNLQLLKYVSDVADAITDTVA